MCARAAAPCKALLTLVARHRIFPLRAYGRAMSCIQAATDIRNWTRRCLRRPDELIEIQVPEAAGRCDVPPRLQSSLFEPTVLAKPWFDSQAAPMLCRFYCCTRQVLLIGLTCARYRLFDGRSSRGAA